MTWNLKTNSPLCDVCGKFISHADLASGAARHVLITPDSEVSTEETESLCKVHNNMELDKEEMRVLAKQFCPDITDEEFENDWQEFMALKKAKSLN